MSSLGGQSSIYALTLDEFQHKLCEEGKNFGSMNMDEFLSSIWNVEENQTIDNKSVDKGTRKQPSLSRQGSLTIPAPLSGKTVDQVWSEIHSQSTNNNNNGDASNNVRNSKSTTRQPTYGEMTLEDFLIKAGVIREPYPMPAQYGLYPNNKPAMGPTLMGCAGNVERDASGYPPPRVCYRGGGYVPAPVSPVSSSDGMAARENTGGMEMGLLRGRKRIINGPVEKLVERRQRRMIKNRESAARSRARKQAYTVELEAELSQLRKENAQLKLTLVILKDRYKCSSLFLVTASTN
ncbi:protein ABSCISIC ACID-INSENSITIVE 5 [Neltuma alba]|uniref:protein ABSCISIC ACID-INSENSITIVE 5 n=1 Tax=Neltuma alba TaxID=207710 RepID=UPI0010A49B48|nr:protein ABSCISIC ACID-INSENSITIVE 5 [Prosopis alba]